MNVHINELVKRDPDEYFRAIDILDERDLRNLLEETLEFVNDKTRRPAIDYEKSLAVIQIAFSRYPVEQMRDPSFELAEKIIQYLNSIADSRDAELHYSAAIVASVVLSRQPHLHPEIHKATKKAFNRLYQESLDKIVRSHAHHVLENL